MTPSPAQDLHITIETAQGQPPSFTQKLQSKERTFGQAISSAYLAWRGVYQPLEDGMRLDAEIENTGNAPIEIRSVRLELPPPPQGGAPDWRVFLDAGECAWCGVKRLSDLAWERPFDLFAELREKEPQDRDGSFHRSSLQTALADVAQKTACLYGFLRQRYGYNGIDIQPKAGCPDMLDSIQAWQMINLLLKPGEKARLDALVWLHGANPLDLLEQYAALVQAHIQRDFTEPPIVGMMTWYGYRTAITEEFVLQNAGLVAELFSGYPQPQRTLMLIDHGWQPDANWGNWDEADPQRFPGGMRQLSEKLRASGLELALWVTPFCVTENCPTLPQISAWLACGNQDQILTTYANVWGQLPGQPARPWPVHLLDGSLDDVQDKWRAELQHMAQDWNCVYWKLDFFGLLASQNRKLDHPIGDLYARTYQTYRQAVGEQGHLAPCSCETNIQLGYNDSIRIAADIGNAGTWPQEMEAYGRGLTTIAALWYKHRRFWINDADSIQVGCGCGLNEARVRATAVAFSGGHLMVSEDLRWISPERIEIIRRLLPAFGKAARPLDLFEHPSPEFIPRIWQLPVESDWGARPALAVFNLTDEVNRVTIQPEWLGLQPGESFGAVEWWQQRWLGTFEGAFVISIPAADVAILHAQAVQPYPWLVSVSHHFTGGWIVENLRFDHQSQQLQGEIVTRPGLSMALFGTIPPGWMIPSNADYHGRANGAGGWAHEVKTTATRTPFTIHFARQES